MRNLRSDLHERLHRLAYLNKTTMEAIVNRALEVGLAALEASEGGRAA